MRTTVAEIARRAGVQRLTVYIHFPEDAALFGACQARWIQLHPLPDLAAALAHDQPADRLRAALLGYYRWYRETAPMAEWVQRDRAGSPPSTNSCNAPPTPDSISSPANSPRAARRRSPAEHTRALVRQPWTSGRAPAGPRGSQRPHRRQDHDRRNHPRRAELEDTLSDGATPLGPVAGDPPGSRRPAEGEPVGIDVVEPDGLRDELLQRQPAGPQVQVDEHREVAGGAGSRRTTTTWWHRRGRTRRAAAVRCASAGSFSRELIVWVAPKSLAHSSFRSSTSIAMIVDAPARRAPAMAALPTPPQPMTAMESPRPTLPVLIAAPMPAITPQPSNPATSGFTAGFTFVHCPAWTRVFSTNAPMPSAGSSARRSGSSRGPRPFRDAGTDRRPSDHSGSAPRSRCPWLWRCGFRAGGLRWLRLAGQDCQDPLDVVAELGQVVLEEVFCRLVGDLAAAGKTSGRR